MNAVIEKLLRWTRPADRVAQQQSAGTDSVAYRIHGWPQLHNCMRTAAVYRLLSVMSVGAVNLHWMLGTSGLTREQLDQLLRTLQQQKLLQVTTVRSAGLGQSRAQSGSARREAPVI
jgi:hypothetical protein